MGVLLGVNSIVGLIELELPFQDAAMWQFMLLLQSMPAEQL